MTEHIKITIHPRAPLKPAEGLPCNGCGVCCLVEPCPLGMVLSLKTKGACRMLRWHDDLGLYRCGALEVPLLQHLARRWIAAGVGCDCSYEDGRG